jgi:hypothetical protein
LGPKQMTHFALQPAARRGDSVDTILRYGPAAAALAYPLVLMLLHRCGQQLAEANTATAILCAGLGAGTAAALIVCVPLLSFVAIRRSDQLQTRRLAHLAFAAPPLFTVTGVLFFLLGIPNGDYAGWGVLWAGALAYAARNLPETGTTTARSVGWIRTADRLSAGIIIAAFVIWHLANHVVALWSLDQNKAVMDVLLALVSFQHRAAPPRRLAPLAIAQRAASVMGEAAIGRRPLFVDSDGHGRLSGGLCFVAMRRPKRP